MRVHTNNIDELYIAYIKNRKVSTDTREIGQGDVFIALKGANFNGNQFAEKALQAGASVAFIDEVEYQKDSRYVVVEDTLTFLQEIAHYHRQQLHIPIIGITGTNGKTTTKELCHIALSCKYNVWATKGNLNNHIGVPLSLLSMDEHTEIGIIEMGANHPGEIRELCEIADPDYGLITNVGEAHLEGFGSYENIIQTKNELYEHVTKKGGKLFVCADDTLLMELSKGAERVTYGTSGAFIKGEIKQRIPYLVYSLKTLKGDLYIKTHLTGGYNFANAMAASCVGLFFNVPVEDIQKSIEKYQPSNLRSQLMQTDKNVVIMDAYNANPSSMKAAITNFADFNYANKAVVLGEMLELGNESERFHHEIAALVNSYEFKKVFLIGKNFEFYRNSSKNICYFASTSDLINYLKEDPIASYYVFVKGSRGNRLEHIVEYL